MSGNIRFGATPRVGRVFDMPLSDAVRHVYAKRSKDIRAALRLFVVENAETPSPAHSSSGSRTYATWRHCSGRAASILRRASMVSLRSSGRQNGVDRLIAEHAAR